MLQKRWVFSVVLLLAMINGVSFAADDQSDITVSAEETVVQDVAPSLENLAWLVGHWQGDAFGGVCEEIWNPPLAGTMTGTFKLAAEGEVSFYELMVLKMENGGPSLTLKHFNADMTGWEEKDSVITFPFVKMTAKELQLDGLIYRSTGADSLQIVLTMTAKDGNRFHQFINCSRVGRD